MIEDGSSSMFKILNSILCVYIVHLRKRKSDNGKLRPPSTSAITYWQIEKDKPLNGRQQ